MNINKKAKSFYGFVGILVYALVLYIYYQYNQNYDDFKFQAKQQLSKNISLVGEVLKRSDDYQKTIDTLVKDGSIDFIKLLQKEELKNKDETYIYLSKEMILGGNDYNLIVGQNIEDIDKLVFDKMFEHIVFASLLIFFLFPFIGTIRKELKKEAKEQLEQQRILSEQQKLAQMGELLNNISHQWRQPLTSINSTVASIEKSFYKNELNEKILDEKLSKIETSTQYMSDTIEDFRNYFKPNKPKDKFLISTALNNALTILSSLIEKNNIQVGIDIQNDKELHLPKGEYIQVVMAIISNAIDQLVENKITTPNITIIINESLKIEDNGGGIKKEYLDKVFDLNFSTKLDKKGTGLGMYMAKMIVENSFNGTIQVSNGTKGAIFHLN